jgi:hypothetical protein
MKPFLKFKVYGSGDAISAVGYSLGKWYLLAGNPAILCPLDPKPF